jgi:hypothetical protein
LVSLRDYTKIDLMFKTPLFQLYPITKVSISTQTTKTKLMS